VPPRLIDLSGPSHVAEGAVNLQACLSGSDVSAVELPLAGPNCQTGSVPEADCLTGGTAVASNYSTGSVPRN
jgi:hypothetical protein